MIAQIFTRNKRVLMGTKTSLILKLLLKSTKNKMTLSRHGHLFWPFFEQIDLTWKCHAIIYQDQLYHLCMA